MHSPDFLLWCTVLTVAVVGPAMVTDLRWRRIPNFLTLPALGAGLIFRTYVDGWIGLGLGLAGAVLAPVLLLMLHGGRGLGMGDLKLATAIGAIAGPVTAAVMIVVSTLIGGILAIAVMCYSGGILSQLFQTLLIGFPFANKAGRDKKDNKDNKENPETTRRVLTMPYGVALGVGSLLTLAVSWWTGREDWFVSFVKIAANQ